MTTHVGTFRWTGDLPDDDDVASAAEPMFEGDFGEQWQYIATEPVIQSICDALKLDATVSDLQDPKPEDHGWYTYFAVDGWTWFLYVQWGPDENHGNGFEFEVHLCNRWWHRIIHHWTYELRIRAIDVTVANALATADQIDDVAINQRAA